MNSAISESELSQHIAYSKNAFYNINKQYHRGILLDEELRDRFKSAFQSGFHDFIKDKNLKYKFNDNSWKVFVEEYNTWKETKCLPDNDEPWLYLDKSQAGKADMISFFKLMEAFLIPVEYFKPFPDGCVIPEIYLAHSFHDAEYKCVRFFLTDDGGLFSDENPVGKTYVLVDCHNLKAELEIREMKTKEIYHNCWHISKFCGFGTIEGYTSDKKRDIYITDIKDSVIWLYLEYGYNEYRNEYNIDAEDELAFRNFPLWKEYHEVMRFHHKIADEHQKTLIQIFS